MITEVRRASAADAVRLAEVHVRSWRSAYRGLVPQDYLDALDVTRRAETWGRILSEDDPASAVFVAETQGRLVGLAQVSATRDDDQDGSAVGELTALYVEPDAWGEGVGRGLLASALTWLEEARYGEATLWVLEGNRRARRFYEANHWRVDGAVKTDESRGFPLEEVRYRRALCGTLPA